MLRSLSQLFPHLISVVSNGTPKPPVRGRPNCRRTAKDIEASISAAELKSKDPMFSTYHVSTF